MADLTNPHDRFFKEVMSREEVAKDFAANYLPEEVTRLIDLATLEIVKDSFVDKELQEAYSDLLYQADLKDGGGVSIYLLFEHKSFPEPLMAFHLLRYMVRILFDDLRDQLPRMLRLWRELLDQRTGLEYVETALRYLAGGTSKITEAELREAVKAAFEERGEVLMATIADAWLQRGEERGLRKGREEGIQQGVQQGIQQGIRQGLMEGIELALELRFGDAGLRLLPAIGKIEDPDVLRSIRDGLRRVSSVEELQSIYIPDTGKR